MQYDLPILLELCEELGISSHKVSASEIEVLLDEDLVLCFQNLPDDDCLIGFKGTPWHTHGNAEFVSQTGDTKEVEYLDILIGLQSSKILICEHWRNEVLTDRYLIHADCNDEFKYMDAGDRFVVKTVKHI